MTMPISVLKASTTTTPPPETSKARNALATLMNQVSI